MITWVMGGTAVGKKHFMDRVIRAPEAWGFPEGLAAAWIHDGDMEPEALTGTARALIVRWQWGREEMIRHIKEETAIAQGLIVVVVPIYVQMARMQMREGGLKWPEWNLRREAEDIEHLAQTLSMQHALSVRYVDGTTHEN